MLLANCKCYPLDGSCPGPEGMDELCEVVQSVGTSTGAKGAQKRQTATPGAKQPLLFPAPPASAWKGAHPQALTTAAVVAASWPRFDKNRPVPSKARGSGGRGNESRESRGSSNRSWRHCCEKQRAKLSDNKALVRRVAAWGPEVGHLVDLRTGRHRVATYWLRDDARSLCIFNLEDTQVRVYACAQMERCESVNDAPEVTARQFFLGLDAESLTRAIFITMERTTHSMQVASQGHVGIVRAQLLLLCKDCETQRDLLGALRALMAEMLVHNGSAPSADAFNQLSEHASTYSKHSPVADLLDDGQPTGQGDVPEGPLEHPADCQRHIPALVNVPDFPAPAA